MTNILIFKIENKLAFTKKKREDSYYCSRTHAFKIYWKLKQFPACSCNMQALFHCVVASVCPIIWARFPGCLIQSHSVHLLLLCSFLGLVLFVLLCLGFELLYLRFVVVFVPKQLSNMTEYWTHKNNGCSIRLHLPRKRRSFLLIEYSAKFSKLAQLSDLDDATLKSCPWAQSSVCYRVRSRNNCSGTRVFGWDTRL